VYTVNTEIYKAITEAKSFGSMSRTEREKETERGSALSQHGRQAMAANDLQSAARTVAGVLSSLARQGHQANHGTPDAARQIAAQCKSNLWRYRVPFSPNRKKRAALL
jgi:hypothetical protein